MATPSGKHVPPRERWYDYAFRGFGCFAAALVVIWTVRKAFSPLSVILALLFGVVWGAVSFLYESAAYRKREAQAAEEASSREGG